MITVAIPTKNRYDCLDKTLLSLAFQTLKPKEIIVMDDSDNPQDIRNISHYAYILQLLQDKGIEWKYVFGLKKGQHFSHQYVQEEAKTDFIFRIDDDEVAEPDVLQKLYDTITLKGGYGPTVGAVAPSVTLPHADKLPKGLTNKITDLNSPNMQWFTSTDPTPVDVDHLYSCFLYRRGITKYDLSLSTVAHREETIFSHLIKKAGYSLFVRMDARVHHFRSEGGGIRTFHNTQLWEHDEKIFRGYLNRWGVTNDEKIIVLDNGLGDHWAFKNIMPFLKAKHKKIVIAACFPEVFLDEKVRLMSIAEAKLMYGNIDGFSVYKYMADRNWSRSVVEAFKGLYLNEDNSIPVQQPAAKREEKPKELSPLAGGYRILEGA